MNIISNTRHAAVVHHVKMKKATGRRADYLSHQNKLAEVQLEETSARLDKQLISKSAAYQHERRQLAQELRDFAREKKRMTPRSQSPPPDFRTNLSGGAIRKNSVPAKILSSTHRYLDVPSHDTRGGGDTISRRPRAKSKSLVDLPNELELLEAGHVDDSMTSYDLLPRVKRGSNESVSKSWDNGRKHSLQGLHTLRLSPRSPTNHLPPISPSETRNHALRSPRGESVDRRKGEVLLDVPRCPSDKEPVTGQRHLRPLKIQSRNGNEFERSAKTPTSPLSPSEPGRVNLIGSQDRSEVKQNTENKMTEKLSEHHHPKPSPSSPRIRKYLEAERLDTCTEITDSSGRGVSQINPGKIIIINSEEGESLEGMKSAIDQSQTKHEPYYQADNNSDETASINAESVLESHQRRHSRKVSTGSQQIHLSTHHAPSQESLQRAVRKVSTDSAPLISISAAIHGKARKAGTGLAPNLTNVFLDSTAYQSGDSGDGNTGLALDSESVTVSNDSSPGRRLSHGVPMNAAERSRERGSLALRGNRVRQEDPSTADLIRYYQDVPEAAALAGISVEPLNLSELESCRYLRKYVPKSMREEESLVE